MAEVQNNAYSSAFIRLIQNIWTQISLNSNSNTISAEMQQKTCQFLPSSMRAANPNELKCRLATSGNFIANVIFIIEIIIIPNVME